jgi:DNA-binding protein YbaB
MKGVRCRVCFDKMKQLMEMKKQADRLKKELDGITTEVSEVSGITIVINGSQDFKSIEVDESLLQAGNKKRFEADMLRSMNAAIKKSQELAAKRCGNPCRQVFPVFDHRLSKSKVLLISILRRKTCHTTNHWMLSALRK